MEIVIAAIMLFPFFFSLLVRFSFSFYKGAMILLRLLKLCVYTVHTETLLHTVLKIDLLFF